jgi:hypothetical protein
VRRKTCCGWKNVLTVLWVGSTRYLQPECPCLVVTVPSTLKKRSLANDWHQAWSTVSSGRRPARHAKPMTGSC